MMIQKSDTDKSLVESKLDNSARLIENRNINFLKGEKNARKIKRT